MSFNGIVTSQIEKSHRKLSGIKRVSALLLEDVSIRIERQGLDPISEIDMSLDSGYMMIQSAALTETTDSGIFLNSTSRRIKTIIHRIVGESPDIVSDIVKAVVTPIQKIIKDGLKPIQDTLNNIPETINGFINDGISFIQSGFDTAATTITTWIDGGLNTLGEGITFVQTTVNNLLEGIANAFDGFILTLQASFKHLTDTASSLFSFELDDIMNLQDNMTKRMEEKQVEDLRKRAGVE